eukprot:scaffold22782_cov62-Phaeocystis_antarctica.AAC.3
MSRVVSRAVAHQLEPLRRSREHRAHALGHLVRRLVALMCIDQQHRRELGLEELDNLRITAAALAAAYHLKAHDWQRRAVLDAHERRGEARLAQQR